MRIFAPSFIILNDANRHLTMSEPRGENLDSLIFISIFLSRLLRNKLNETRKSLIIEICKPRC